MMVDELFIHGFHWLEIYIETFLFLVIWKKNIKSKEWIKIMVFLSCVNRKSVFKDQKIVPKGNKYFSSINLLQTLICEL